MRIVVVSDTHQNTALLEQAVRQAIADGPIDGLIHCGDGVRDLDCVEAALLASNPRIRIYAVKGNCDLGALHWLPGQGLIVSIYIVICREEHQAAVLDCPAFLDSLAAPCADQQVTRCHRRHYQYHHHPHRPGSD